MLQYRSRIYLRRILQNVSCGHILIKIGRSNNRAALCLRMSLHSLCNQKNRLLVRRHCGQHLHPRFVVLNFKCGFQTVSLWGGFSFHGRTPLVCTVGDFNQHTCRTIIDNHILPFTYNVHNGPASFILQEDNCGPHRAKSIANHLANEEVTRMQWTPQSPDRNRIQNLWNF